MLVELHSLNPIDPKRASGVLKSIFPLRFPFVPGGDFSGLIEAVGAGVTGFTEGDAVFGYSVEGGAYAERIAIDADKVARKPSNLSHAEAASLALVGQTAAQAIEAANVAAGCTVLIQGAGGAVGSVAVQLAHRLGATVIAAASTGDAERLRGYGVTRFIDRTTPFEDHVTAVDAVIDTVGGIVQTRSLAVLKVGGMLVALSQPPSQEDAGCFGVNAVMLAPQTTKASLDALRARIEAGDIVPCIRHRYRLAEAAQAWRDAADKQTKCKTIFEIVRSGV